MGECFITRRGGGSVLNLRVVGGAGRPTIARENDIWVETNAAITDWSISPTEPANKIQGMVWIYSAQDAVHGLKVFKDDGGGVIIYPTGCKQWNGGGWVKKPISIFMNGLWKVISCPIYQEGNEFTAITGGWEVIGGNLGPRLEKTANCMNLHTYQGGISNRGGCLISHCFAIDFKQFRKLSAVCLINNKNQVGRLVEMYVANETTLACDAPDYATPNNFVTKTGVTVAGSVTLTINLEGLNLSNAKYVIFKSTSVDVPGILSISKIELLC